MQIWTATAPTGINHRLKAVGAACAAAAVCSSRVCFNVNLHPVPAGLRFEGEYTMLRLDLYLVPARSGRPALFSPHDSLVLIEAESQDRVRQFIEWVAGRPNRILAWLGRGIRSLHDYYLKLEDRIDPVERVLKAMASTRRFVVHAQVPEEFYRALRRQRWKHVFWFSIDFVLTGVVIVFTPILAPIPG